MSGEFLTQTLAPGQTMQFTKAGKYFEIIADGGSTFNFNFYGPNGAQSANWKNCQAGMFLEDPYSAFDITNNSTGAQTITMLLMDNGRGGSRRQPGTVRVVDQGADKTNAGKQFLAGVNAPVDATHVSWVGFDSKVGGGQVAVKSITVSSATAGLITWGVANVAGSGMYSSVTKFACGNKLMTSGAASASAEVLITISGAAAPTAGEANGYVARGSFNVQANVPYVLTLTTPIILNAGALLLFGANVVNRDITVSFDFEEL